MEDEMKGALSFENTVGEDPYTTLTIDRARPMDLSYLFSNFFREMDDFYFTSWNDVKWEADKSKSIAVFKLESTFFRGLLGHYNPGDLSSFLKEHVDIDDFHNESLVKRLDSFDEFYERIYCHNPKGNYFLLEPMNSGKDAWEKVKSIESIFAPEMPKNVPSYAARVYSRFKEVSQEEGGLEKGERGITKPYKFSSYNEVLNKLNNQLGKPLFPVSRFFHGPSLDIENEDYFPIIRYCEDMPTDHLKIARK